MIPVIILHSPTPTYMCAHTHTYHKVFMECVVEQEVHLLLLRRPEHFLVLALKGRTKCTDSSYLLSFVFSALKEILHVNQGWLKADFQGSSNSNTLCEDTLVYKLAVQILGLFLLGM